MGKLKGERLERLQGQATRAIVFVPIRFNFYNSVRNRDSGAVVYKAAEFLKVRSREAKTHWRRRLIEIGMCRIRYRIQSITCRAGQPDPSRAAEVLLAADANAFSVLPSHGFGNFCGD